MVDFTIQLDEKFVIKKASENIISFLNISESEIIGKDFFEVFFKVEKQNFKDSLGEEKKWIGEVLFCFNYNTKNFFAFAFSKRIKNKIVHNIDFISTEKLNKNILSEKNQFKSAFENIDGFIWQVKIIDSKEEVFYSDSIKKVTGYSPEEITQFTGRILNIIFKEDIGEVIKSMNDILSNTKKNNINLNYRITKKNGETIWIKENISIQRDPFGKPKAFFGIAMDVSNLKEKEIHLTKSEIDLQETNIAKDRFINILSHDLRAPFTSILGFAEILLNEPNLPPKEKNEYLTYIYEASQNQLDFVNYLLDWSRLRTGSLKIEPQRLKAQSLVYSCVSNLTGNAIRKNIEIKVDVSDELFIQGDERLLSQVVSNLLNNAIKFSSEGSLIEISANYFNREQAEFVIRDFGIGLSQDDQQKIFSIEKTFSTDGTKGEKGTGLGLALVKEIIDKHNGEIWFYSELGKGSEFHFTFPLPTNTILLVENEELEKNLYLNLINKSMMGFDVITAENGFEAINISSEKYLSLLITNHQLPLMDGAQLIESIKKGENSLRFPVVVIANNLSEEVEKKYYKIGVKAIINKPIDSELFIKTIKSSLN